MESVGVPVQRKELERDAVPTIQTKRPHGDEIPVLGKRRAKDDSSPAILTSTPKEPRRAFLKREFKRILLDFGMQIESALAESNEDPLQTDGSAENFLSQTRLQIPPPSPQEDDRYVGFQLFMPKPQRRSLFTQKRWKTCDKVVQAVEKVTTREIGISCNLLPAPPLRAQPRNVPTLDESFAIEETDSIQDEVEDPDESF